MKICVFCSANQQIDPDFFGLTEELGRWAAENGHTIVFGGVNLGLMECVGKAAKQVGGRTIGIIPMIVEKSGRTSDYVDIEIPCDNLSDRKQLMMDQSDVFMKGFWDSLVSLLDDLQAKGMVRGEWRQYIKTADSIEEIKTLI